MWRDRTLSKKAPRCRARSDAQHRSRIAVVTWSNRVDGYQPVEQVAYYARIFISPLFHVLFTHHTLTAHTHTEPALAHSAKAPGTARLEQVMCAYCKRHGYDRWVSSERRNSTVLDKAGITWQKIPLILEVLPHYEAILHVDDDSVINHLEFAVEKLLEAYPDRHILLSAVERNGRRFQGSPKTSTMVVRNTPFTRAVLSNMLTAPTCAPYRNMSEAGCCHEQVRLRPIWGFHICHAHVRVLRVPMSQDCLWQLIAGRRSLLKESSWESAERPEVYRRRIGILKASDLDCRDDKSYHATIHKGKCDSPFVFHGLGTAGWPKWQYITRKAYALMPIASHQEWAEGKVSLQANLTHFSSGQLTPQQV